MKKLTLKTVSLLIVLAMLIGMSPLWAFAVEPSSDVLLEETWTQSHTTGHKYWSVDFNVGEVYTITASWTTAPEVETHSSVKTAWKLATVAGNTGDQSAVDTIFLSSRKSGSTMAKGFQGVFVPTQNMDYLNLYIQAFTSTGNTFSIKVEKGNKLGTAVAAGQELVYDAYISIAGGTTYLNAYFNVNFKAGETYTINASYPEAPTYTDNGTGSGWKLNVVDSYTTETAADSLIVVTRNKTAAELTSQTKTYTPSADRTIVNFFTQKCTSADRTIHIVITKDSDTVLNEQVDVTTTDTAEELAYTFEQGKAYKVTAAWTSDPSFPTGQKGWSLTTGTTAADGDLVVLANTGASYGEKVAGSATVIFTATADATKLYLDAAGITADNTVTVTVEPAEADAERVVDITVTLPAGARYTNVYSDAAFVSGQEYDYDVQWTNQPTHTTNGVRAWKIQSVTSSAVDGAGDMFYGPYSGDGVSDQTENGRKAATATNPVFNLFTQYLSEENTVHIVIDKYVAPVLPTPSELNTKVSVAEGEAKYFACDFEVGKTYKVTAQWDSAPSVSGVLAGWKLQTVSDLSSTTAGDLVFKAAKKDADGTAGVTSYYQGIFTATAAMDYLKLTTTGMAAANNITVNVEEVTLDEGVVYEGTVNLDADLPWLHTWVGVDLSASEYYKYTVSYASIPSYTEENEGKTAWKLHFTENEGAIAGTTVYTNTAADQTAKQTYSAISTPSADVDYLSFFTQRTSGSNTVTVKVEVADPQEIDWPYEAEDKVTVSKLLDVPGSTSHCINEPNCTEGHPMQAFDIYDGVIFVTYDGGYVMTYDLETGEKISEFMMGCAISHEHHCGNAMFGTAKYDPDDRFPLFYSSGDLSTKACYVERILTDEDGNPIGSQLIQWINFDMGEFAGANGAQAVVDPGNNRILFQQRKYGNIGQVDNAFVIGEYPLPAHTEGTLTTNRGIQYLEVSLDTDDFLKPAYELPYWGPMYQGADYYDDQLLQTHGPTTNGFGSNTGLMTFQYAEDGSVTFSRYIYMTQLVGNYEPQGVSVWNGKLYISYYAPGACIFEVEVILGIDTTGTYEVLSAKDDENLAGQVAAMVNKQLADAGKDYTVSGVEIKTNAGGVFTADVTVMTPYTFQTVSVSGTVGDHSFTNYVNDNNAACETDGTKTAQCDHEGCTATDVVVLTGTKLGHSFTNYVSDGKATCTADGTKTAKCDRCDETDTVKEIAHGHKLTKVDGKAATCTESGVAEHYSCSVCKKTFADAEGKTEMGNTIIAAGHTISKVDGKAPTETENGHKEHYACASCGKLYADAEGKMEVTKASLVISATGAPVDTGDDFSAAPILLMMILSATAMAVLVIKRKEF